MSQLSVTLHKKMSFFDGGPCDLKKAILLISHFMKLTSPDMCGFLLCKFMFFQLKFSAECSAVFACPYSSLRFRGLVFQI